MSGLNFERLLVRDKSLLDSSFHGRDRQAGKARVVCTRCQSQAPEVPLSLAFPASLHPEWVQDTRAVACWISDALLNILLVTDALRGTPASPRCLAPWLQLWCIMQLSVCFISSRSTSHFDRTLLRFVSPDASSLFSPHACLLVSKWDAGRRQ